MNDLNDDNLKDEEQFGGFNTGEPDDDSFLIQNKNYPDDNSRFINPEKPAPVIQNTDSEFSKEVIDKKEKKKSLLIPLIAAAIIILLLSALGLLFFMQEEPLGIFSDGKNNIVDTTAGLPNSDNNGSDALNENKENQILVDSSDLEIHTPVPEPFVDDAVPGSEIRNNEGYSVEPEIIDKVTEPAKNINVQKQPIEKKNKQETYKYAGNTVTTDSRNTSDNFEKKTESKQPVPVTAELRSDLKEEADLIRNKTMNDTFAPKDEQGVYIVQIYSSPSKEDALTWLGKLKDKNIADAFISEQNVRDKVWYRVRFGNFRTRDEARNAALRYGFAQTWIDRVK